MLGPPWVRLAIVLSSASFFSNLFGQTEPSSSTEAREADEELNRNYKQVMQSLPPKSQEELRKAQRAWLAFVDRNSAAIRAMARKQGRSLTQCNDLEVRELREQARYIEDWSRSQPRANETKSTALLQREDAELNTVYQRALQSLDAEDAQKLREAQRAWVAFRDASHNRGAQFVYALTADRVEQINDFYIGTGDLSGPTDEEKAAPDEEQQADPTTPDPFERAR
ncbi:MAG TPA: lysozyme inhibitor LprI family protein [Candidatus Udaeobacter sp.]|jgi:uncharacterized protein YecT (DUF1311 family)